MNEANHVGTAQLETPVREQDKDAACMLRVAEGETAAFEDLVNRYQSALVQYFTIQSQDPVLAEDLAQEVFLRLYRSRASYRPTARFKTFLYRIARNLWLDNCRSKKRAGTPIHLDDEPDGTDRLSEKQTNDPTLSWGLNGRCLLRAVSDLPEKQRDVLLLGQIEEMPYPEIARVLEIPVGTVKSRMYHALENLRAHFGKKQGNRHD
ncbi:MAG: sigma-70 family RNA polymerase sigma factor [Acidobacteriota bacterium]|nr:sigma-70 family RNA polymerase sigma factor [Acidobacteriota bacterium]